MRLFFIAALGLCSLLAAPATGATIGGCKFDTAVLAFRGDVGQQTKCLLKKVKVKGAGAVPQDIPAWLTNHVGMPTSIDETKLRKFLADNSIDSNSIGGPLIAASASGIRYFVIHDTSSPEVAESSGFPADMDKPSYSGNKLANWNGNVVKQVNLIISRDGKSRTYHPWGETRPWSATKLELSANAPQARPLFVHVENVQPRLKPSNSWAWIAPVPGLTASQEKRLALAYIAASYQAGTWLIPAYHFNIDQGLPDGHDDPQNMDLVSWTRQVEAIDALIKK